MNENHWITVDGTYGMAFDGLYPTKAVARRASIPHIIETSYVATLTSLEDKDISVKCIALFSIFPETAIFIHNFLTAKQIELQEGETYKRWASGFKEDIHGVTDI